MPLTLHVDAARWRGNLRSYAAALAGTGTALVPVVKGNGYGFGNALLAAEAATLGVQSIAVGDYVELDQVTAAFPGDLLVLTPWRPWIDPVLDDERVVHTVSRLQDLRALAARAAGAGARPRVVLEVLTGMRRHGIPAADLGAVPPLLAGLRHEGWALHLPLAGDRLAAARDTVATATGLGGGQPLWVSHLDPAGVRELAAATGAPVRSRVGTALWLGERGALSPRATVIDRHRLARGTRFGYRQRPAPGDGTLLVLAGGTAHGVGMEAPSAAVTLRQRGVSLAHGALGAAGRALSPYTIAGRQRWFAEPPHMQVSLVWLPGGARAPEVGEEVPVEVRYTTTRFDAVVLSPPSGR